MIEMCRREVPARSLSQFDFRAWRQIYDTGKFTIAGDPIQDGGGAELRAVDGEGRVAMTATAKFS
jgi:hydroxyacyl-ACP dehydratase HTD2-like protein with hotdog domain